MSRYSEDEGTYSIHHEARPAARYTLRRHRYAPRCRDPRRATVLLWYAGSLRAAAVALFIIVAAPAYISCIYGYSSVQRSYRA